MSTKNATTTLCKHLPNQISWFFWSYLCTCLCKSVWVVWLSWLMWKNNTETHSKWQKFDLQNARKSGISAIHHRSRWDSYCNFRHVCIFSKSSRSISIPLFLSVCPSRTLLKKYLFFLLYIQVSKMVWCCHQGLSVLHRWCMSTQRVEMPSYTLFRLVWNPKRRCSSTSSAQFLHTMMTLTQSTSMTVSRTFLSVKQGSLNSISRQPKPVGLMESPTWYWKSVRINLLQPFQEFFQCSLDTGLLPKDWLNANIAPVFKKGDRHAPENYRPVSLTSVLSKILEHFVCHHLMEHLTTTKSLHL